MSICSVCTKLTLLDDIVDINGHATCKCCAEDKGFEPCWACDLWFDSDEIEWSPGPVRLCALCDLARE